MAEETILQHWIFTQFAFPFLLIFFLVFGILEKSKLFGENKQLNALIAFVVGLIFVGAIFPKLVVANLILFLTIAIVVMFVGLLLWGFVAGDEGLKYDKIPAPLKGVILVAIVIAVLFGTLWAAGIEGGTFFGNIYDLIFGQDWSASFWTNAAFVLVVVIALAMILKSSK